MFIYIHTQCMCQMCTDCQYVST